MTMKIHKQYDELYDASLDLIKIVDEQTRRLRIAYKTIENAMELTTLNSNEIEMYGEMVDDIRRNNESFDIMGKFKEYSDMYNLLGDTKKKCELYQEIFTAQDELRKPMV